MAIFNKLASRGSAASASADPAGARRIVVGWDAEDTVAWQAGNRIIARRNLIWSTATTHVAFSVWSLWSVVVLFMPESVYGLTAADKLLLVATATLVGGCVRIPYTAATAKFGGRNWAVLSSLVLLIPTAGTLFLLVNPYDRLWPYLTCAALTGLGGGNYSASLANVDAFYPQRLKGMALGMCGGIGNLGVAVIQLFGLLILATVDGRQPYLVCALYLVLLTITSVGAALRMDNLDHDAIGANRVRPILPLLDTWVIALLYSAAFGSFIGFAFVFAQVLDATFIAGGQSQAQASLHAAEIAFAGPLIAGLTRICGGWLADQRSGSRVTFLVFVAMIPATGLLITTSIVDDHTPGSLSVTATACYIAGFFALFVLAGMGNGSVLKMIPSIFEERSRRLNLDDAERRTWALSRSGALIGFATAVGAFGGVAIDLVLRQSYTVSGTETPAFWLFLGGYCFAATLTWVMYVRRRPPTPPASRSGDQVRIGANAITPVARAKTTNLVCACRAMSTLQLFRLWREW